MYQYYIFEIQQYANGEYGHIVHFAYDKDEVKARLKAESKWHEVLAAAAVSEFPSHSATLITADGRVLPGYNQCYKHAVVSTSESEPETESEEPVEGE